VSPESAADIERLWEAGRSAWPGVDVTAERFAQHFRAHHPEDGDPSALHAADLYLACACEDGEPRALAAFEARYIAEVPRFLTGVERSAAAIEEVRQLVRERLFIPAASGRPKIAEYSGRGSLASWLRVVTLRVASNRRRAEHPHADLAAVPEAELLPRVDPELAIVRARYRPVFDEALRAAFGELTPRERTLFRMHYVDGLSVDRIGAVYNVHRATVARWIAAAREGLFERITARLRAHLHVSTAELESLLTVVRSGLQVSLGALLLEGGERV
jgi:RNA polymerase sigma-70 factor (ECF subfamily)